MAKDRTPPLLKDKYDKLTIIGEPFIVACPAASNPNSKRWFVRVKCDCGIEKEIACYGMTIGAIKSCGRHKAEYNRLHQTTHGLSKHPLNVTWLNMRRRCQKPNHPSYKDYGARGISVVNEWSNDFKKFYDWCIGNGYKKGLTLERKNNNGNYEPSNCMFIPQAKQPQNTRASKLTHIRARHIRILGKSKKMTYVEISKLYCVSAHLIGTVINNKAWVNT